MLCWAMRNSDRRLPDYLLAQVNARTAEMASDSMVFREIDRLVWKASRSPSSPRLVHRRTEDPPVVHAGNTARLVREHRFDDAPFAVAEFIAHDSMLPFGSLNHAQGHGINGQTACPLLGGERTYGRHSEIDAIDPKRKSPHWLPQTLSQIALV